MSWLYEIFGIPFGYLMMWIYDLVQNYGVAIILFTLVTKLILLPVNYKTQKNAARMQLLNPELAKIRKSYKDNPQKMQEEQMKLYQREGVNPMGSCLPAVIQMVLLFGVLDVVYKPLTHIIRFSDKTIAGARTIASEIGKITIKESDLRNELSILNIFNDNKSGFTSVGEQFSEKVSEFYENFSIFGINLGAIPSVPESWSDMGQVGLFLVPIFAGLSQLVYTLYSQIHQKKKNPDMPNMGCMNVMLYLMPLLSVFFAFQVAAGVGFYWIFSSIFSFAITVLLNHYFSDKRIAAIVEKEREKAKKYAEVNGGKKTFMQKMLEQQQAAMEEQKKQQTLYKENGEKMSRSEANAYNRQLLNEARKRMAEKYGDDYNDE
ncbi:MAG: membrane protein insertase YidC [Ruminococcus sp.]|nr:membrane protein insertase YidC [Ruminococcus sp.]MBO5382995.1 membrane protein insertase YidC [Ruminococcus sp.]MBR6670785.1 membrane protein insertase YidC [Ruminococcus sp.]